MVVVVCAAISKSGGALRKCNFPFTGGGGWGGKKKYARAGVKNVRYNTPMQTF